MSTTGTKGVPRAEREAQILDIATGEFGLLGFAGASLGGVAARAGVSKPMVLAYFASKEGLFAACARRAGQTVCGRVDAAMATAPPSLEMPQAVLRAIFEALAPRPHDWNVIWDRTVPPGGPAHEAASEARRRLNTQAAVGAAALARASSPLAGGAADPDDAEVLAAAWTGMVSSVVNWWLRHPDRTAAHMAERCTRVLTLIAASAVT